MFRFPNVHNLVGTESHHNIRVTATESENNILESNNCQSILACMFDIHKEMERLMKFHSQLSDRLQVVTSRSRFFSFADIEHSSSQLIGPNNCSDIRDEINTSDMEISSEMNFTCEDSQNQSSVGTLIACNSPVSVEKSDAEVHTPNSTEIRRDDDSVSEVQFNCSSLVEGTVREKSIQSHTSSITCDINERTRQDGNGIESNQGLVVETYENLPVSMTKVELINGNPCGMSVVGTINAAGSPKSLSEKSESEQNYCSSPSSRRASRNSGLKKSLSSRHSSQAGVESRSESLLEVNTSSRKVNYRRTRCHSEQNDSVSLSDGESESCHSESSLVISIARRSSRRRGSIRSKTLECSSRLNLDSQLKKLHNHSALAEETEDSKCNVSAICSDKLKMEPGDQPDFHKERWNQRQSRNRRCNSAGGLEHLGGEKIVVLKQEPDEEARSCHFSLNDVKMKEIEKDVEKNEKLNSAHMGNSTKTDEKCENDLTDNMCVLAAKGRGRQRKIARGVSFESSNSECLFSENGQNDSTQSHFNSQVIETQINTLNSDKIPINRLSSDDTCESDEISTKPNRRKRKRENSIKLEMEADSNTSDLKPGFALKKSRLHQDTDQVKELHSERNNSIDRKEELQGTSRSSLKVGCRPTRKRMRSNSDDSPVTHSFPNIRKCCVLLERLNLAELSGLRGNVLQTISEETSATSNKADNKLNLTELSGSRVNVLQTISEESLATSNKADNKLNLAELSGSRVNVLQTISEETSSTSDMADNKCSISERNSNENSTKLEKDITDTNENLDITKCEVLEKDFPMTNRRGISSPKSNLPISKIFEMLKSENASSPAHSDPTQEIESQLALLEEMSSHLAEHSDSQENLQSLGCDVEEDNLSSVSEREENSSKVTIACQDVSLGHQDQKTIFNDALLDENSVSTFVSDSSVVSDGEQMPMKTPRDSSVWFSSSPDDCDRDSVSSYEAMQENSEGSCKIKTSRKHKHIRKSETPEHMVFDSHIGSILDLKTFGRHILAACEDGKVYCYSLKSGRLKHVYDGHGDKVICLLVLGNSAKENDLKGKSGKMESDLVFTGSLDNHLRCFDFKTGALINKAVNVRSPVQCMDQNWGTIFIGTKTGKVARFSTKLFKLADNQMECSKTSVLALKATKEGPRNVLVVATSNEPLAIRDATTGLLLRSFGLPRTVFSLVLDSSFVYCGTKTGEVIVLPFTTGEEVCKMKSGNGVSCMKIYNNLLFAGCYDGYIYVYSLKSQTLICRIEGGKMMLCLDVMKNRIIAGSKSKLQTSIFPVEIRNFLKEEKYRSSHGENNSNVIHSKELPITGTKPKMGLIKS
ncbi:uncharacterized protein [Anabrus simplex]|uniref:uncharacterized protein n=1 Tax=Anabrus simplex TaxID=316456 RepID=UPI0035A2CBEE